MSDLRVVNEKNEADNQYIIFNINKESYAIDVSQVNNIIQMPKITKVPKSPEYFSGVISLRGEIIPIMSLHRRMNYGEDSITKDSRIIILNIEDERLMGVIVDEVKEVLTIPENEIEQPSPFINADESFIRGIGKKGEELISILKIGSLTKKDIA
ncbi:chemotaxis protein CheW [Pseudobutyrivibrio sp.]|uniref:chemotaxis protein CheW n=1 Tax=Pseudobutyrivibrio sp. TaxID=2014367 RepID=UPI001D52C4E2|nr:chemotaxis protein CheW [Pseudobutyrivibrio sp.]MBE5910243.1 chemotaxis protein CheW [Pseudobutyrivibrio sp.]